MVYTEIKEKNGKKYFYRVLSIRKGPRIEKKRIYLGVDLDKKNLTDKEKLADKELMLLSTLLNEKEKKELEILEKYLPSQILQNKTWEGEPEQLSEEEIKTLVKVAIEKVGAKEMKDLGKVMQELIPQVKGKADGSLVGKIVKELLTPKE